MSQMLGADNLQTVLERLHAGDEIPDKAVSAQLVGQRPDLVDDDRQRLAENLGRVTGPAFGLLGDQSGKRNACGLRNRHDGGADADAGAGLAQPVQTAVRNCLPVAGWRVVGRLGRHVGIAVPAAADPAAKAYLRRGAGVAARGWRAVVEQRHRVIDAVPKELQSPFDFVRKAGAFQL